MAIQAASNNIARRAVKRMRELITFPLYDSVNIPAAAAWNADLTLFASATTPGQHLVLSNMKQVGFLTAPQAALVQGFSVFVDPAVSGADLKALLRSAAGVFKVNTKDYFNGPLWMAPGAGGAKGTGTDLNTNGDAVCFNRFKFGQPVEIPSMQQFEFIIKQPPAGFTQLVTATRITVVLWTTASRSVQ